MGCSPSKQRYSIATHPPDAAEAPHTSPSPELGQSVGRSHSGFHKEYNLPFKLGSGHYACVYMARTPHGEQLAVKVGDLRSGAGWNSTALDNKRWQAAVREVGLLKRFVGQEHIIQFVDAKFEGGLCYILMEMCEMPLLDALQRMPSLTEGSLKHLFCEMLAGIWCVHSAGVIHRDIKPDNFMCKGSDGSDVKLCDFGTAAQLATSSSTESLTGVKGTPAFMAPEMLSGKRYDARVDMWSFGVIAYMLFFGTLPYELAKQTKEALKAAVVAGTPSPSFKPAKALMVANQITGDVVSKDALKWIQALLCHTPSTRRLSAQEALSHSVFKPSEDSSGRQASLRPMLMAAVHNTAFCMPSGPEESRVTSVDVRIGQLQGLPPGQVPPKLKAAVPAWSRQTTPETQVWSRQITPAGPNGAALLRKAAHSRSSTAQGQNREITSDAPYRPSLPGTLEPRQGSGAHLLLPGALEPRQGSKQSTGGGRMPSRTSVYPNGSRER
mmetsp:Transcript_24375/g.69270  ORF Transcript_24375/g.69270 Transcript_24375/m.69270 type:complete len:496 (+) Transcript_24375:90-1577(+)